MTKKLNIATHLHCFFSLSFSLLASPPQAADEGRPFKALFLFAAKLVLGEESLRPHPLGTEPQLLPLLLGSEPQLPLLRLGMEP